MDYRDLKNFLGYVGRKTLPILTIGNQQAQEIVIHLPGSPQNGDSFQHVREALFQLARISVGMFTQMLEHFRPKGSNVPFPSWSLGSCARVHSDHGDTSQDIGWLGGKRQCLALSGSNPIESSLYRISCSARISAATAHSNVGYFRRLPPSEPDDYSRFRCRIFDKQAMNELEPLPPEVPGALAVLVKDGTLRRYKKHTLIISEGDLGASLFILLDGAVRIYSQDEHGRELDFGLLEPGTIFGEMALEGGTRTASVEAVSQCLCAEVPYALLKRRLAENPDFAFILISTLIGRSRSATESAKNMALKTVYQRFIEFLERESIQENGVRLLPRKMSQQELANIVGASRDMISKILKDLAIGKYIQIDDKRITILKSLPNRW
ncbi:MAG TPA: Crp/Fnr family transcriptional regulator [Rhodocyclaceae bacterium]|nr:Crp/Fnr family transcriptional regulator [Rhodocyclaceae bacterium]